jgi:hypothetical protein
MAAKKVRIAPATTTNWVTLPGNTADFQADADMLDDTIFGYPYKSMQPDILKWQVSANAIYKGYAGYQAVIKKTGVSTVMTGEPMSQVAGQVYQVTDATKRLLDIATTVVVKDNNVDHTANVDNIDFLFGRVTFTTGYVVTGPVTITGAYLPSSQICAMNKYTLTQQAEHVDLTDLCVAQTNGGYRQFQMGLKTVALQLSGFYRASSGFLDLLKNRSHFLIEINPDGVGKSVARGFFVAKSDKESGKVGNPEDENVDFDLYVPDNGLLATPFSWVHDPTSTLNTAVQTLLTAWQLGSLVECRYLEDGVTGKQGSAVPTNLSMSGGLGALNEFTVQLQGSGAITAV